MFNPSPQKKIKVTKKAPAKKTVNKKKPVVEISEDEGESSDETFNPTPPKPNSTRRLETPTRASPRGASKITHAKAGASNGKIAATNGKSIPKYKSMGCQTSPGFVKGAEAAKNAGRAALVKAGESGKSSSSKASRNGSYPR